MFLMRAAEFERPNFNAVRLYRGLAWLGLNCVINWLFPSLRSYEVTPLRISSASRPTGHRLLYRVSPQATIGNGISNGIEPESGFPPGVSPDSYIIRLPRVS